MGRSYKILRLSDRPEEKEAFARWFHEKWGIPLEAYRESMDDCLAGKGPVPQWYVAREGERIIGGMGVIENDFHDRRDLTPQRLRRVHRGGPALPGGGGDAAGLRVPGHGGGGDRHAVPGDGP